MYFENHSKYVNEMTLVHNSIEANKPKKKVYKPIRKKKDENRRTQQEIQQDLINLQIVEAAK